MLDEACAFPEMCCNGNICDRGRCDVLSVPKVVLRMYRGRGPRSMSPGMNGVELLTSEKKGSLDKEIRRGADRERDRFRFGYFPATNVDTLLSLLIGAERPFASADEILILCLWSPLIPFLLGDVRAAGMIKSGVAATQRLSSDAAEGVGDFSVLEYICPDFRGLRFAGLGLRRMSQIELATDSS